MEKNHKSPHILNTSATLLGLCFIVLTTLKVNNKSEVTLIDELTAFAIITFMCSCILSFISMLSIKRPGAGFEKIADYVFLAGLLFLFVSTMLIVLNIIE
jgi:hypothetical protein